MFETRACWILFFLVALAPVALSMSQGESDPAGSRPHIVLILADDLGISDIGCYGGEIPTPQLDRLAAQGLRFKQFYNTGRCCPTRASLLTGLYAHQAGVGHMMSDRGWAAYRGDLNPQSWTLAEVLKASGYATYMVGKWHVTRYVGEWTGNPNLTSKHNWPVQRGFDQFIGTIHGAGSFYDPSTLTRGNTPIEPPEKNFYYTDFIGKQSAAYISAHLESKPHQPFFCYMAFTAPHWPLHAPAEAIEEQRGRYDRGWNVMRQERLQRMRDIGFLDPQWEMSPAAAAWENNKHKPWQRAAMEVYAAMVARMDAAIGQVVQTLERHDQLDNTLIMFMADNGGCAEGGRLFDKPGRPGGLSRPAKTRDGRPVRYGMQDEIMPGPEDTYQEYGKPWANFSNTPFRLYKHWVHEGGIASPLVVHWPGGIRAVGEWRNQVGHVVDLMPTLMEVSGAAYPPERHGRPVPGYAGVSLVPAFSGRELQREAVYWEHEGNRAIRMGDWKLVARFQREKTRWELYNMARDRSELRDLAAARPHLVSRMAELYRAWAVRVGVQPWPLQRAEARY